MKYWLCSVAALLISFGTAADACSMIPGYKVPTNLELAAAADTIVIAKVTGERKAEQSFDGVVVLKPVSLLKGGALPQSVEIKGAYLSRDPRVVIASDPRELRRPNPGALIGGCVRYTFLPDAVLLLFLKRDGSGNLKPFRSSFSRDAEDVVDDNSLWVKAVREYAEVSKLPRSQWKSELKRRMSAFAAKTDDADAQMIASDMKAELSGKRLPPYD